MKVLDEGLEDFLRLHLNEETLNEAEPIILDKEQTLGNKEVDLKQMSKDNIQKEKQADIKDKIISKTKQKGKAPTDQLEAWFEVLVPQSGKAPTVAGEMVRAMMRIVYRYFNDGDKFFDGYGIETCAPSVSYLVDSEFDCYNDFDTIASKGADIPDEVYEKDLENITEKLLTFLNNNWNLTTERNEEDSRDYDIISELEENSGEWIPHYEFSFTVSDKIAAHLDQHNINSFDITDEVESWFYDNSILRGLEIDRPWGYEDTEYTISNATSDQIHELENWFGPNGNNEDIWEDYAANLNEEFGDPDDFEEEDDEYEEDDDSSENTDEE